MSPGNYDSAETLTAPAIQSVCTSQQGQGIGQNSRKSAGQNRKDPETGEAFAHFVPCVPAGNEIGTA